MEKKIIEEPIFEKVQTGVSKKEVWVTSDGKEFDSEQSAEQYEFYECKLNQRHFNFPHESSILDLHSLQDLERYVQDYCYDVSNFKYDKNELTFPNTYVLYQINEDDDMFSYPEWSLYCVTLEEYKNYINKKLNEIKVI